MIIKDAKKKGMYHELKWDASGIYTMKIKCMNNSQTRNEINMKMHVGSAAVFRGMQ